MNQEIVNKIIEIGDYLAINSDIAIPGLYGDSGGKILFFTSVCKISIDKKWKKSLDLEIEKCFDLISNGLSYNSYSHGITGYFRLFNYLDDIGICLDIKEVEKQYEDLLYNIMISKIKEGKYDFLHESLGIAFYFLKNGNHHFINEYINILYDISIRDKDKIYWIDTFDSSNISKPNIGLAHGISSIIIFLSYALKCDLVNPKIIELLNGSVNFILSQRISNCSINSCYPTLSLESGKSKSRLGWCYGDLSIALALWQSGCISNNSSWKNEAVRVFNYSCNRHSLHDNYVFDACICHGTSGIAQIYRRMYYETGFYKYLKTSDYWISETMKMSKFSDGTLGFKKKFSDGLEPIGNSLIEGISGIGLVLLSSIGSRKDSKWDELFLMHL